MIQFDPHELNYSKVKAFRDCPLLFRLQYMEQKRPALNAPASLGISLHRALERFHRRGGGDLDDLFLALDGGWLTAGYQNAANQAEYYWKGRNMLEDYFHAEMERKTKIAAIEQDFEFRLGPWKVRGTIDRVDALPDGTYDVIDYKTGPEEITEQDALSSLQLGVYAIGARVSLKMKPATVSYWLLAYEKKVSIPVASIDEERVLAEFSKTGEEMLVSQFPPRHENCHRCHLRTQCPKALPQDENIPAAPQT